MDERQIFDFNDQQTDMGQVFKWIETNLYGQNVGALIIVSDGIVNQGTDPLSSAASVPYAVYTVALGDTLPKTDIAISKVEYNKVTYIDTRFPIVVSIKGNDIAQGNYVVKLMKDNQLVEQKEITVNSSYFFQKVIFNISEKQTGLYQYNILVDIPEKDANHQNNDYPVFVHVKNDQQKILFLQESWHPDAAAFEQVLKNDQRYQLTIANASDFKADLSDYSLIILHQLPSTRNNLAPIIKTVTDKEISLLFILGEQTQINALNQIRAGIEIQTKNRVFDDVYANLNSDFSLFTVDFDQLTFLRLPPLHVPFGDYREIPGNQVLFYQQVGNIVTRKPLVYFAQTANQKVGFICGEGIWRWRLVNYFKDGNHHAADEIISKTVQYLANRDKKDRFIVNFPDINSEDREIVVDAILYNKSFEMINNKEVNIVLTDAGGIQFPFQFQPDETGYTLNLGQLNKGRYHYKATAENGSETLVKEGDFMVTHASLEKNHLTANFNLLNELAIGHNGHLFEKSTVDSIPNYLAANQQLVTTISSRSGLFDLINLKALFFLIVLLLGSEWFLRKYWGLI